MNAALETRRFGSTPLDVTSIGLGLAAVGRPAYINIDRADDLGADRSIETMRDRAFEVMDAAFGAGVRYFDAARSYGRAEEFLAAWMSERRIAEQEVTVGSKWGYRYVGEWRLDAPAHEVKEHSSAALRAQFEESNSLLGDRLNVYQIHSATLESGVLENHEVLAELARLGTSGLVIGLTVSGPRQAEVVRKALEVEVEGVNPFRSVQATWNALEPSVGPALQEAHEAGWGVIVKEALANGRLAARATGPERSVLSKVAQRHHSTMDGVAIANVLARAWVHVVLSGAVSVDQLASNLGAAEVELTEQDLDELSAIAEPPDEYWAKRSALPWN